MRTLAGRLQSCIAEGRMPSVYYRIRKRINMAVYRTSCLSDHYISGITGKIERQCGGSDVRCLYVCAIDRDGKPFLEKIANRIDLPNVDILLFCYDDTTFDEEIFSDVKVIRDKGLKWEFMKRHLTPDYCVNYDYVFVWDDDIDPLNFSFARFIDIMQRNRLECAQPALAPDSHINVDLTRARCGVIGRFTDYVENMVPVFTRRAWSLYWNTLEEGKSRWGWQHSRTSRSACGYRRMGVVDQEVVAHTRLCRTWNTDAPTELKSYMTRHPELRSTRRITIALMH